MTATALSHQRVAALCTSFGLGEVLRVERLAAGTINSNYQVETAGGRVFLRVNEGKSDADVDYEVALIDALAGAGVRTPVPLATADGRRFIDHEGKQVCIFPWLGGAHRAGEQLSAAHLEGLGEALAGLHEASAGLGPSFHRRGIYTTDRIAGRCAGIDAGADTELAAAVVELGAELSALESLATERAALPTAIIHGDLFPDNVLFEADELVALLDFEQASTGAPIYDLAVCLNAWCHDGGQLDVDLARALLTGYRAVLEPAGLSAAALWIECRAAAARFAVTRITDVHLLGLSRPGKDYREYLSRLRSWHRLGATAIEALL